jgi:hypothetical protein
VEAGSYELARDVGSCTMPCSRASRIIFLILVMQRALATKGWRSRSEATTEHPKPGHESIRAHCYI